MSDKTDRTEYNLWNVKSINVALEGNEESLLILIRYINIKEMKFLVFSLVNNIETDYYFARKHSVWRRSTNNNVYLSNFKR